ncbi:MAG: DUF6178 family protein [bacterium]|jgi:hypothetical protein
MPRKYKLKPKEEIDGIAALDDPDLRDRLSSLSLGDQAEIFRRSDWLERIKVVKNSDLADELVASMPDEEILLTFKGAGEENGLALIAHCTDDQLRFILDIDLWSRHALDEERVIKWLGYLVSSGEKAVVDFVRACDLELVVVFLTKLIRLIPFDDAVEMGEELTSIMPDEAFVVQSLVPEETPAIRLLLTTIMAEDRDLYSEIRFSTYRAIATETEDEAYRWRNSRLEEKGILEYEEASRIYEGLSESETRELLDGKDRPYYRRAGDIQVPAFYPLGLSSSRVRYLELLCGLEEGEVMERIAGDVSYVTNRLLIAGGHEIGDVEATRDALDRLFSFANVGLLHLAERTGRQPAELLEAVCVSNLFRLGLGLALDLGAEADEIGRHCPVVEGLGEYALLEDYHVGVLEGLRRKVPQFYEPGATADDDYRDFRTPEEIATARAVLAQISVLAEVCFEKLGMLSILPVGLSVPVASRSGGADTASPGPAIVTRRRPDFGNALMTVFARSMLGEELSVTPLKKREISKFLCAAFTETGKGGRTIDPAGAEKFLSWLETRTGFRGHKWAILEAYVMERLELVEEELAGASSAKDVDSLLVESMLLAY